MLGALPVVDHFLDRLSMAKLLEEHLPGADGRVRLAPAKAIGVVVRNLALSHQPLYSMNDWATGHDPAFLGLEPDEVSLINDDRIGRALERLFEADRSSLLGRLVLDARGRLRHRLLRTAQRLDVDHPPWGLHPGDRGDTWREDDRGRGEGALQGPPPRSAAAGVDPHGGGRRCGADRPSIGVGQHRGLDYPHRHLGQPLCTLGRNDFLYWRTASSATRENMEHIDKGGGRFVSVLPATRKEDGAFRRYLVDHEVEWTEALRRPARHIGEPDDVFSTTRGALALGRGFRVIWVRSSHKVVRDADARSERVGAGVAALDDLNQKLLSNRSRLKSLEAVEAAAAKATEDAGRRAGWGSK